MDEGTADDLYRRLKKTDASARQKLGLGFEARHSENCQQSICGRSRSSSAEKRSRQGGSHEKSRSRSRSAERRRRRRGSRSRSRSSSRYTRRGRTTSRSRSAERRRRSRSRSWSADRRGRHARSRSRSRSPKERRRGSKSSHRHRRRRRRSSSSDDRGQRRSRAHSRDRHNTQRSRSPDRGRNNRKGDRSPVASKGKKPGRAARPDKVDYATKIRGYDRMSTFEKLKAKTKFDLSSAFKGDEAGPDELGRQWTRFVFNNDAPLEEEGARPDTKFGRDDDGLAELNSVSFRTSNAQSHIDNQSARHEDAIFSASVKAEALADDTGGAREGVQPSIIVPQATSKPMSWRDKARMQRSAQ
mmetsp:Transcript_32644/g.81882  ORF Transcript_32644/g.81882 Transcript_32644/m.81882 type:complete len:357 (+) Transcript_32644:163-1233(+)